MISDRAHESQSIQVLGKRMTYVELGEGRTVLSASPERFVQVRGSIVETDPMKGTRPRGETPAQDRALRAELESCEKERAVDREIPVVICSPR